MSDTSWRRAREIAASLVAPGASESVPLAHANRRVLASDVRAAIDLPAFPTAAMDGWAVSGAAPWRIVGQVSAGDLPIQVSQGEAVRIGTGAIVPSGADAVIPWEIADVSDGTVRVSPAHEGNAHEGRAQKSHIRPVGEECARGDLIALSGTWLTPVVLGHLAAAGIDTVDVRARPRVDILIVGDEVVTSGIPGNGMVRDALGVQLPLWLDAMGVEVVEVRYLRDEQDSLRHALEKSRSEFIVTTGGTSRGHRDYMRDTWREISGSWHVDGVAVRPGHPMMIGTREIPGRDSGQQRTQVVIALPGNPLSALVALMTLGQPVFDASLGRLSEEAFVRMAHAVTTDVTRIMVGSVHTGDFVGVDRASSAMLAGASRSQGWAVVEPPGVEAGAVVPWLAYPW